MINIYDYLYKDVKITTKNGKTYIGHTCGMLYEDDDDDYPDDSLLLDDIEITQIFACDIDTIEIIKQS